MITQSLMLMALGQIHSKRPAMFGYLMDSTVITSGDRGQVMEQNIVVASTSVQWDKLRLKLGVDDTKNKELIQLHGPLGSMDWTREQVVFVRSGEMPTGGYSLSILRLEKSAQDGWTIDLQVHAPKKDTMVMQMLTRPYLVFRMRKTSGKPKLTVHSPDKA